MMYYLHFRSVNLPFGGEQAGGQVREVKKENKTMVKVPNSAFGFTP